MRAGFEQRFDHMVRIFAVGAAQVQREAGIIAKRAEKFLRHTGVKIADALLRERSVEHKVRAAADIYGAEAERFIHRDHGMAVAHDAAAVAERLLAESIAVRYFKNMSALRITAGSTGENAVVTEHIQRFFEEKEQA